jgi:hypothetical protein
MDDATIGELAQAVGHLDAGQIADLIRSSANADAFEDPDLVAAFIASRASAG